jgi:hypothetical protein
MEHYIKKNILIDELLDYNLTYNNDLLHTFQELRNCTNFNTDIILLNNSIEYIDTMLYETNNYINNYIEDEYQYIIERNFLNNLYEAKNKIINYLKSLEDTDILADLINEINIT